MKAKKTLRADLENKKRIFLEIGIILTLVLVWMAFEWKHPRTTIEIKGGEILIIDVVDIPITTHKPPPPPPPPAPTPLFEIVENKDDVPEIVPFNSEGTHDTRIFDIVIPPYVDPPVPEPTIFIWPEEQAEFPGGPAALLRFLSLNLKYPKLAQEMGIQGTVYLTFVVERNGSISNIQVVRTPGAGLEEEAIRVLNIMPPWKPGKQGGTPVRVQFNLPVRFKLQ
jgi:periplasmic protein TonB